MNYSNNFNINRFKTAGFTTAFSAAKDKKNAGTTPRPHYH